MAPLSRESQGILLVIASSVSFGMMPIFAVFAYRDSVTIGELLFLRFLFASIIMGVILALTGKLIRPSWRQILALLALGGIAYFLQATLYFTALLYLQVSLLALILYSYPAFVTAGSISLGWERLSRTVLVSLLLALAGLLLVTNAGVSFALFGVLAAVASAIIYSIYILASSRILQRVRGDSAVFYVMLGAAVSFGLLDLMTGDTHLAWKSGALIWVILVAIVGTCIAVTTFLMGIEQIGPSKSSILSVIEPMTAIIASSIVFSQFLNPLQWLGGALIISAVVITATVKSARSGEKLS